MKVVLFLTVAFAIASVVSANDHDENHHKKKADRSHGEKKHHHGERSHDGKKSRSHERSHEDSELKSADRHHGSGPYCNYRQMVVCNGYSCTDLTCANYDANIENFAKCLYETNNNFSNMSPCRRSYGGGGGGGAGGGGVDRNSKCVCRIGLVLDETNGRCVKKSECMGGTTDTTISPASTDPTDPTVPTESTEITPSSTSEEPNTPEIV